MAFLNSTALRLRTSPALRSHSNLRLCPTRATPIARTPKTNFRMMTSTTPAEKDPRTITDSEWRERLSPQEYKILRQKGTEYPGTGEYDGFYPKEGHFVCRACGNPLYSAESKFKSGCGWPAFDKCYVDSIKTETDNSFGMRRVEIMCARCDGHLGHVFEGERMTETNERHCVNSLSMKYVKGEIDKEQAKVV